MLSITTCQAENTFTFTRHLADYLSKELGIMVQAMDKIHWTERYRLMYTGDVDIGWICSLPYALNSDKFEILAAPIMTGARYAAQPVYFSDVIVRAESPFQHFLDLRGASWAYNEPNSQSGYNIIRHHLAQLGETVGFFGRVFASGTHLNSIDMVLDGRIDTSAIDSTVLDWVLAQRPLLADRFRIIETLGPSPIPPLVIQKQTPVELVHQIRTLLLTLHEHENGRCLLADAGLLRFTAVDGAAYAYLRQTTYEPAAIL